MLGLYTGERNRSFEESRAVAGERDGLMVFLDSQRDALRAAARGLTDEQARSRPTPTTKLSVAALLKHLAYVERDWTKCYCC